MAEARDFLGGPGRASACQQIVSMLTISVPARAAPPWYPTEVGFFRGIAAFFGGVAWVVTTPRIWLRAMAPMLTALVVFAVLGYAGVRGALLLAHHLLGEGLGASFLGVLLAIVAGVLAMVIGVALAQPLSGWALEGIVRAQERDLGVAPSSAEFVPSTLGSLGSALLGLVVGVPTIVLLTAASWVFPPIAAVTVPLKAVIAAILLAWDLLDYPLASRGMDVRARLRWCAREFGAVLGFGLAALLVFAVPGLGLVALPCGVAGAVRLASPRS
jgi:CysZ protein